MSQVRLIFTKWLVIKSKIILFHGKKKVRLILLKMVKVSLNGSGDMRWGKEEGQCGYGSGRSNGQCGWHVDDGDWSLIFC